MSAQAPGEFVPWAEEATLIDAAGWPWRVFGEFRHRVTGAVVAYAGISLRAASPHELRPTSPATPIHGAPADARVAARYP